MSSQPESSYRISRLKKSQAGAAASLMSKVFNRVCRKQIEEDVARSFDGKDRYHPVIFAAVAGRKVVGTIECDTSAGHEAADYYSFTKLAVDPDFRRRGIGEALVKHAEEFICTQWLQGKPGRIGIYDETKNGNPASRYYEKMGYAPDGSENDGVPSLEKPVNVPQAAGFASGKPRYVSRGPG